MDDITIMIIVCSFIDYCNLREGSMVWDLLWQAIHLAEILWLSLVLLGLEQRGGVSRVFVGYLFAIIAMRPIQQYKRNT